MIDSQEVYISPTSNNMFTQGSWRERQGSKSDHITSPGVTTAKTESQVGPVQRRREHRGVM